MIDFDILVEDFVVKHAANLNSDMIKDLNILAGEMYGDGYCKGHNEALDIVEKPQDALEWWEHQDGDDAWTGQHDLADLEAFYGEMDLQYLQEMLEQMDQMEASYPPLDADDLPPGFPFDRRKKDE